MTEPGYLGDTRAAYDVIAGEFAEWIRDELATKPLDRAVLAAFAELAAGPVADVGCGSGRITAHLRSLGVDAFGIDLSPEMIAVARRTHPGVRFEVGSMTALDLPAGSLGGLVAWYSVIHVPPADLPAVLAGFRRVLAPGGWLQLAFDVGDEPVHRDEVGGHRVSLDFHPRRVDRVAALLTEAGFEVRARLERAPDDAGPFPETAPQAFVLARRPQAS
ncbi:methyltransferase domain-containing protein [Amycolatopsis thermalba]|uniref:Methyltransferase domain-containing protein n=1 Tax=Amycolatopsis thermalba TaxID=944492 RepID=A0ABY4NYH2_9PSEU|nr:MULTISPECIES: class I SAM-dependent methyltransferase [Amycolatopsis]UQS25066.1 methyltransferase domain-containing protein [Amycolatopsis thermalba]